MKIIPILTALSATFITNDIIRAIVVVLLCAFEMYLIFRKDDKVQHSDSPMRESNKENDENISKRLRDDFSDLLLSIEEDNIQGIDSEKYDGAYRELSDMMNEFVEGVISDIMNMMNGTKALADGDFDVDIKVKNKRFIKHFQNVRECIKSIDSDINRVAAAAAKGDFNVRIDTERYKNGWKDTAQKLNYMMETIAEPFENFSNRFELMSKGDFQTKISNNYEGEFENMKDKLNKTAEDVSRYINDAVVIITRIAERDLSVSTEKDFSGDFASVKMALEFILGSFNSLIAEFKSSSSQVAFGANQISATSVHLSEGATTQAGAVESLNHITQSVSEQAKDNAEKSSSVNDLAISAKNAAAKSRKQMNDMLTAMNDIKASSSKILNFVSVIDEIAFQTNILALNAAVEAARAGGNGKGFAVVADEVRTLATRSQKAARETNELVDGSIESISAGSEIANGTAASLNEMIEQIDKISSLSSECASISKEQENALQEISEAIVKISEVTISNTATSEELAAASEELASQAELLNTSVSTFILK